MNPYRFFPGRVIDVPEHCLTSAKRDSVGSAVPGSAVEPMNLAGRRGYGSLGVESTSTLLRGRNGDTFDDVSSITPDISVSGLVEQDDDWNLDEIWLSKNADVPESLHVDFTVIQPRCHDFNLAAPIKLVLCSGFHYNVLMPRKTR